MHYHKLISKSFSLPTLWTWAGGEAFLLFLPLGSPAQSLDSCLAVAERNNPTVAVATKAIEQAKALEGTAFELDPTDITFSQDLTGGGSPDNGISVSQQFALPSLYRARRRQLRAETELERRSRDVVVRSLRREVASAYYDLCYRRERVALLQAQDSVYAEFERLATAKTRGGETSRLEQLNAERLHADNQLAVFRARQDQQLAQQRLQVLMGTPAEIVPQVADFAQPDTTDISAVAFDQTPEGAYLAQKVSVGQLQLQTLRREALPRFSVGLTGQLVVSGLNPYNVDRSRFDGGDLMAFEVGVSVPLSFGAQKARKRAAQAGIDQARLQQQQAARQREGELQQARQRVERSAGIVRYYQMAATHAAEIARTSTVAYEQGEIGYVEHMQNLQTAAETQLARLDALGDYQQEILTLRNLQTETR